MNRDISDKVVVYQRVVSVKGGGRQNIHVRICNITAKSVVIKPKSVFCELREVSSVSLISCSTNVVSLSQ
jgi:hypothetical protein